MNKQKDDEVPLGNNLGFTSSVNVWDKVQNRDEAIQLLAMSIIIDALYHLESVLKLAYEDLGVTEMDDSMIRNIEIELIIFSLHWVDRLSYMRLGREKRDNIMDQLTPRTFQTAVDWAKSDQYYGSELEVGIHERYNERQKKYWSYKEIVGDPDGSRDGTLFVEFLKHMAVTMKIEIHAKSMIGLQISLLTPGTEPLGASQLENFLKKWHRFEP